ncbi:hypothetical protein F2P81_025048 [Scophthalmus maximus]|uniref:Uncharacterized protein n=1 Tax=Scophthalmus maximus TaxID=52904 RepID=A0A6A4RJM3_SCOMX|nr:hypothetical protein F2P81_025048 [Scophthalmus maximus]
MESGSCVSTDGALTHKPATLLGIPSSLIPPLIRILPPILIRSLRSFLPSFLVTFCPRRKRKASGRLDLQSSVGKKGETIVSQTEGCEKGTGNGSFPNNRAIWPQTRLQQTSEELWNRILYFPPPGDKRERREEENRPGHVTVPVGLSGIPGIGSEVWVLLAAVSFNSVEKQKAGCVTVD